MTKAARIALAQTTSVLGDVERNVEHHIEFAKRAKREGAQAIVFPELSLTGYTVRDLNVEVAINPNTSKKLDALKSLSKEISICCGGIEQDGSGAIYNAAFFFEDGELAHVHRKMYPPTYGIFEEMRYFSNGKQLKAFDSKRLGRIGVLVCEDLWHMALPYVLASDGAQLIMTIAASPTRLDTGEDAARSQEPAVYCINREHHAAYARLLGVYIAFVNRVGVEDVVNFWGGSELVSPSGETVSRAAFFDEDLQIAEFDSAAVQKARQFSRHPLDDDLLLTQSLIAEVLQNTPQKS